MRRNVSEFFRRVRDLVAMLLSLIVDVVCDLGLCLRPSQLWQRKICFCINNWSCIKSVRSSLGRRPTQWRVSSWRFTEVGSWHGLIADLRKKEISIMVMKSYVYKREGVYWVTDSRVSLDSIVYAFLEVHTAESIQQFFPVS